MGEREAIAVGILLLSGIHIALAFEVLESPEGKVIEIK
jgi:hypothetical protein